MKKVNIFKRNKTIFKKLKKYYIIYSIFKKNNYGPNFFKKWVLLCN